jgi:hypothetical protein
MIAAGVLTIVGVIISYRRDRYSGISPELAELMRTPTYVILARHMAMAHGYPESEWPRFQHVAFAEVLKKGMGR